jgi:hypothetical protein
VVVVSEVDVGLLAVHIGEVIEEIEAVDSLRTRWKIEPWYRAVMTTRGIGKAYDSWRDETCVDFYKTLGSSRIWETVLT